MDLINVLFLIITVIPAASYGWGMRGTTIGGEKGAILPGALIGALLAINSNILIIQENFFIFAALGAIGMYFGGCMTYGETLNLSMSARPAVDMKRGLRGVFLKGFLWFGVFGCVFSTGTNAICKVYSPIHLVILFIITPLLSLIFMFKLNRPYSIDEFKFPKFYFSKRRKEYWGAVLGILISFLIINIINLNIFGIVFPLICALFGGFGWVIAQLCQIYTIHYSENSNYTFIRKFINNDNIDSWKFMECVLGAFGGIGSAVAFYVTYDHFKETIIILEKNNCLYNSNNTISIIAVAIWIILLAIDMLQYIIKRPVTKESLRQKLNENTITKSDYSIKILNAVDTVPKFYDYYEKTLEPIEFILYAAIPFVLITLGSVHTAVIMSVFILILVLLQEIVFENDFHKTLKKILQIIFFIICVTFLIFIIINNFVLLKQVSFNFVLLLYTVIYELLSFSLTFYKMYNKIRIKNDKENLINLIKLTTKTFMNNKSIIINNVYFVLCIIIVLIMNIQ